MIKIKALKSKYSLWLTSFAIFCITLVLTALLANVVRLTKEEAVQSLIQEKVRLSAEDMKSNLNSQITALKRISYRWEMRGGTPKKEWFADARNYVEDFPGLAVVEWVDKTYHVRWVEPLKGNEQAQDLYIIFDEDREAALQGASSSNTVTITPPLDLVQGYKAFIVYAPIQVKGKFIGFTAGLYNIEDLFRDFLLRSFSREYEISIFSNGKLAYRSEQVSSDVDDKWTFERGFELYDTSWKVKVKPNKLFLEREESQIAPLILIVGFVLAFFLSTTYFYLRLSVINGKKAEQLNAIKTDFLANMSHEIRTPMNGVLGMANLLSDTKLSKAQKLYTETILTSAKNLMVLINDILDVSKIESGQIELEKIIFDLRALANEVFEIVRADTIAKGIKTILNYSEDVPQFILGDPVRIRQILINLVGNAVKFTKEGSITMNIQPHTKPGKDRVVYIEVVDTGIGISEINQIDIFNKFSQVDSTVTRKFGGTGLGLSICQSLSYLMGGEIGLESEEGVGTKFWFTFKVG